ncbi:MAG: type II toxin-antitoxin system VapC family toxin [Lewinellaceae bacterium]|nr:type II toxin-antitoxin system VapC family toxin [Saprospiraceae bacterium]MCB9345163.1 type II toxin-antitoxin system VapC family toxin [Lewinellaceae bacterium]
MKHLWDTNTVIYFLQNQFPSTAAVYIDSILAKSDPAISVITEIELLCWKTENEEDLEVVQNFIEAVPVIELDKSIKLKTAELRKGFRIKLPDAIIAATAMVYEMTLITRNTKDFSALVELEVVNPFAE